MIFLCFGNSLTSGYPGYSPSMNGVSNGYGNENSQYEYWLFNYCIEFLKKNLDILDENFLGDLQFINKGIPGELTRNLLNRVERDLLDYSPKPDYSIIIGGTNDLGWGISNEKIFENIESLHRQSRNKNILPIGATIPPIRQESSSGNYHKRKIRLNLQLEAYFTDHEISYADLFNGMINTQGNLKAEYAYTDGLHFSVQGYKRMGYVIFEEVIKEIIRSTYL